jgi:hypothetical protein
MKKGAFVNYLLIAAVLLVAILFVVKFSGPSILKAYIESGIGTCKEIPILCMAPEETINITEVNEEYRAGLLPYEFPKIKISLPKGYTVVQEQVKKVYYKRRKRPDKEAVVYLLYEEPNFFINLFPQVRSQGINDNHEFIKRTMYVKIKEIKNLYDAFFVIIKGIFIPDLGNQKNVKMAEFTMVDKRGFINYNLGKPDSYFDCNIFTKEGDYFKIYIKDRGATLNLENVLAIISTVNKAKG